MFNSLKPNIRKEFVEKENFKTKLSHFIKDIDVLNEYGDTRDFLKLQSQLKFRKDAGSEIVQ